MGGVKGGQAAQRRPVSGGEGGGGGRAFGIDSTSFILPAGYKGSRFEPDVIGRQAYSKNRSTKHVKRTNEPSGTDGRTNERTKKKHEKTLAVNVSWKETWEEKILGRNNLYKQLDN